MRATSTFIIIASAKKRAFILLIRQLSTINILLQHGASLELKNSSKETALVVAIYENRYEVAKRLVDAGADVNAFNIHRRTVLLLAAESLDMTRYLVEHGADVNAKNLLGEHTTLALLRRGGDYQDVIAYLESKGARDN